MNNDSPQVTVSPRKETLAEVLLRPPREEDVYQSSIKQEFWSIDQFAVLMGGLIPENYKNGTKGLTEIADHIFFKRMSSATSNSR